MNLICLRTPVISLLFFVLFATISAQPVLTFPNVNTILGTPLLYKRSLPVSPGQSGANQIWDFSVVQVLDSTPWVCETDTFSQYIFPNCTNVSFYRIGTPIGSYHSYHYSFYSDSLTAHISTEFPIWCSNDYQVILKYPFHFLDTIYEYKNDCISAALHAGNGPDYFRVNYNGFGTLILPNQTLTNVARIMYTTVWAGNGQGSHFYNNFDTVYNWYIPQFPFPIAQNLKGHYFSYLDQQITGLKDLKLKNEFRVYPNPTKDKLILKLDEQFGELEYSITDIAGISHLKEKCKFSNGVATIATDWLQNGYYFIELNFKKTRKTLKFVVLN